ncbi:MAG: HNH endonuclease [Nitrospirota bacterium]
MDPPLFEASEEAISFEKQKGRGLRATPWWKQKCAQGVCFYCQQKFAPLELTMDHVVPLIRGGRSVKGNVVPACKDCNNKKKSLLPMDWEKLL